MTDRFADKVIVITGAAGGIGRATALRFASEGAKVGLVDRDAAALEEAAAAVRMAGGQAIAVIADVSQSADVERYATEVARRAPGQRGNGRLRGEQARCDRADAHRRARARAARYSGQRGVPDRMRLLD